MTNSQILRSQKSLGPIIGSPEPRTAPEGNSTFKTSESKTTNLFDGNCSQTKTHAGACGGTRDLAKVSFFERIYACQTQISGTFWGLEQNPFYAGFPQKKKKKETCD